VANDYKACVSHGYISHLDDKAEVTRKLLELTGPDPFNPSKPMGFASFHKVRVLAQYMIAPEKIKLQYYSKFSGKLAYT
jgi:hypothetical protein